MGVREQTIRISLYFFFLFTPFSSYMTILTHIYQDAGIPGIGPAALACNYTAFIVSTLIAPSVKWPLKRQLLFAGICYTINYSSGIFATLIDVTTIKYGISCIAAMISGASAGLLWVSNGRYIHLVCQQGNALDKKGEMFGLFNSIYCMSNVTAGLITTFGLGFFNSLVYFIVITCLGILSILYCFFFVRNVEENKNESKIVQQKGLISDQNPPSTQILPNGSNAQPNERDKDGVISSVIILIKYMPHMFAILPFLLIDGFSLGVYSSQISHLIPGDVEKDMVNKYAGIAMIMLGVGSVIGGYICGIVADKFGAINSGRSAIVFWLASIGCFVLALKIETLQMAFIAAFMWGFALFYVQGWMYIACSRQYEGKTEAFSINKQLHSLFYLCFQIAVFSTDNKLPLFQLVLAASVFSIPALYLLNKIPQQKVQNEQTSQV